MSFRDKVLHWFMDRITAIWYKNIVVVVVVAATNKWRDSP
jgi:hypothetical protein